MGAKRYRNNAADPRCSEHLRPYAGDVTTHTTEIPYHAVIITFSAPFWQEGFSGCVADERAVWGYTYSAQHFFLPLAEGPVGDFGPPRVPMQEKQNAQEAAI